ncbi:Trm112p-domain-containing protein [Martensiomyces pterosporus]|nr:Trm112p-domain-containing protein [Martensiomyces pterosporus]
MRLITHNMLKCHVRNCTDPDKQFPLRFENAELEQIEAERNDEFLVRMIPRLDWPALVKTATALGIALPASIPETPSEDDDFLQKLHTTILETHVKEGSMFCDGCGHEYKITNGIPNMLLAEHEI